MAMAKATLIRAHARTKSFISRSENRMVIGQDGRIKRFQPVASHAETRIARQSTKIDKTIQNHLVSAGSPVGSPGRSGSYLDSATFHRIGGS